MIEEIFGIYQFCFLNNECLNDKFYFCLYTLDFTASSVIVYTGKLCVYIDLHLNKVSFTGVQP